ncbi:MAG: hypothetical protein GEU74_16535, partial [Nitriliruptorales bacterium]|nr:hypothetical protein [Nitriliruptorales bacterium]
LPRPLQDVPEAVEQPRHAVGRPPSGLRVREVEADHGWTRRSRGRADPEMRRVAQTRARTVREYDHRSVAPGALPHRHRHRRHCAAVADGNARHGGFADAGLLTRRTARRTAPDRNPARVPFGAGAYLTRRMRQMRRASRVIAFVLLGIIVYVGVTMLQVWLSAGRDERRTADAIVVLGAAQYDGDPSPALRARLDHAVTLFEEDLAPVVWVTGGRQPGDRFSEASASSRYLIRHGVPDTAVQLETNGVNTYESLAAAARYLRDRGQHNVLLVSDPWHALRIAATAREVGLRPRVSPAGGAQVSENGLRRLTRETGAVALGRLIGFRRLTSVVDRYSAQSE